jgi:hypothetical protein
MFEKILEKHKTDKKEAIALCTQMGGEEYDMGHMYVNTYSIGIVDFIILSLKLNLKKKFLKRKFSYTDERLLERMDKVITFTIVDVSPE